MEVKHEQNISKHLNQYFAKFVEKLMNRPCNVQSSTSLLITQYLKTIH